MKKITASVWIKVTCKCPNCDAFLDLFEMEDVQLALNIVANIPPDCNLEIECTECLEKFIVTDILF